MSPFHLAQKHEAEVVRLRRIIHESPELSGFEENTLALIRDTLTEYNIPFIEVEKGGIIGSLQNGIGDKTVLLRADVDALPITEDSHNLKREKTTVSKIEGVAHSCGHDAHTAMLLTAARTLQEDKDNWDGKVLFCFERAEETGGPDGTYGAPRLLKFLEEENTQISSCFALHVNSDIPCGKIAISEGPIMAGIASFRVTLTGRGGHASRPDIANSPLEAFIAIHHAMTDFRMKQVSPFDPFTFSIPQVISGAQRNVIEKDLFFVGTARIFSMQTGERFIIELKKAVKNAAEIYHCDYKIETKGPGGPMINDRPASDRVKQAVRAYLDEDHLTAITPSMGSESFHNFVDRYTGALAHLGVGNEAFGSGADLHTPQFDIDEMSLKYGVAALHGYVREALKKQQD